MYKYTSGTCVSKYHIAVFFTEKKKDYDNIGCGFNQKTLGPRNTAYIRLSQVKVTCLAKLLSHGTVLLGAVYFKMDIKFIQISLSILW